MFDHSRLLLNLTPSSALKLDDAWRRWTELARVLLDACEQPAFVLDPDGYVVAANDALTHLVGDVVDGGTVRGGGMVDADTTARGTSTPGRMVHGTLTARDGSTFAARLVFRPVGSMNGLLQFVRVDWARRAADVVPVPATDRWYFVRTTPGRAGEIESASDPSGKLVQAPAGARCHEFVYGRPERCPGCPFIGETASTKSKTFTLVDGPNRDVIHASSTRLDDATIIVLARTLSGEDIGNLIEARIESLASERGLSPRESEVLRLAAIGRSRVEIAEVLGLSPRTVKHHFANLLAKLGADSQSDLIRVLM